VYDDAGRLTYVGHVGTGFSQQALAELPVAADHAGRPHGAVDRGSLRNLIRTRLRALLHTLTVNVGGPAGKTRATSEGGAAGYGVCEQRPGPRSEPVGP
jgi:hypothetical protein